MANTNRSKFELLLETYEPKLRQAFLDAIADIRSQVTLKLLVERLERGDVQGALDALHIERSAFGPLELALAESYNAGGIGFASDMILRDPDGHRLAFRFGVRNLAGEALLRDYSAEMVTRETDGIKAMLRTSLTEGLARGDNPTHSALNMVGRVSRLTGKREGGYLGLSLPQERTQANARAALLAGDVEGMRAYRGLKQRNQRFDGVVDRAIAAGKPLSLDDTTRIIGKLNDRQLKYRGDVIGLHETRNALAMARDEGMRQAIESGKVDAAYVTKTWKHSGSEHPRLQHLAMNNTTVKWGERFIMADGTAMDYPHAPDAPARHTIGCDCRVEIKIDYTGALIERRRLQLA